MKNLLASFIAALITITFISIALTVVAWVTTELLEGRPSLASCGSAFGLAVMSLTWMFHRENK